MKCIKTIFIITLFSMFYGEAMAQGYPYPYIKKGKPEAVHHGIHKNLLYQVILETDKNMDELVKGVGDILLEYEFVKKDSLNFEDLSSTNKTFTLPMQARGGTFAGKGGFSKRLRNPIYAYVDLIFTVNEQGQMMVQITNFSEEVFIKLGKKGKFLVENSMGNMMNIHQEVADEKLKDLTKLETDLMAANTVLGKIDNVYEQGGVNMKLKINASGIEVSGLENIKSALNNLKATVDAEWKILDQVERDGLGRWFNTNSQDYIDLFYDDKSDGKEKAIVLERLAEGYLVVLDNDRFDRYFMEVFNVLFVEMAISLEAKVVGIAKNDKILFEVDENNEIKKKKK